MLGQDGKKRKTSQPALHHNRSIFPGNDPTDAIDLPLTTITKVIESHTVVIIFFNNSTVVICHGMTLVLPLDQA